MHLDEYRNERFGAKYYWWLKDLFTLAFKNSRETQRECCEWFLAFLVWLGGFSISSSISSFIEATVERLSF